jgi:hypothetical protein
VGACLARKENEIMNIGADAIKDARVRGAYNFELQETYPLGTFEVMASFPGTGCQWSIAGKFRSAQEARKALSDAGQSALDWTVPNGPKRI